MWRRVDEAGHQPVDALEEINRVIPVIERLSKELNVPISVDTSKAQVAEKALCAGACIVNDVWGLQRDPDMAEVVSKHGAGVIMMHNSDTKEYKDLMGDIIRFLRKSVEIAEKAGITRKIWLLTRNRLWKDFGAQPGSNEKNEGTKHPKPSGSSWDIKKVHDRKCFGFACK